MSDEVDTTTTAAAEAAREAFFAKLPDPPDNTLVAIEKASATEEAAASEADDLKSESTGAAPEKATSRSSGAPSAASTNGKGTPGQPASTADAAAVLAALKSGDLDTIADLTGADPADFDERSVRWAARNRREAGLKRDVEKVRAEARQLLEHYEPIESQVEAFDASGGKDWAPVRAIVEHVTGKPWAVAAAQLGLVSASAPATRSPAADRVLLEAVRDDVPDDHQVRQLPGWEQRVVQILHENVDEMTGEPAISFKQAAARAVRRAKEEHAKLAPIFGGSSTAPASRPAAPERADATAPGARRPLTKDEFFARFDRAGSGK